MYVIVTHGLYDGFLRLFHPVIVAYLLKEAKVVLREEGGVNVVFSQVQHEISHRIDVADLSLPHQVEWLH